MKSWMPIVVFVIFGAVPGVVFQMYPSKLLGILSGVGVVVAIILEIWRRKKAK
ncbi:MAG: hypothetical protein U9N44_01560 [Chloroflexota bacterium]|nr:hypothetical protein [Chloroflexota bacterium]